MASRKMALQNLLAPSACLTVSPRRVDLRGRGFEESEAFELPTGQDLHLHAQLAMRAADSLLRRHAGRRMRLSMQVSDHWLRPLVLPLSGETLGDAEAAALLDHAFDNAYGPSMAGWTVRWVEQGDASLLAAAWPRELLLLTSDAADATPALRQAVPVSLQVLGGIEMGEPVAWAVFWEVDLLSVVRRDGRAWRFWQVCRLDGTAAEHAMDGLLRVVAQLGDRCRDLWVASQDSANARALGALLGAAGWRVRLHGVGK